jgi:hypothetical protein
MWEQIGSKQDELCTIERAEVVLVIDYSIEADDRCVQAVQITPREKGFYNVYTRQTYNHLTSPLLFNHLTGPWWQVHWLG